MSVTSFRRSVLLRLLPMLFDEDPSCLYRTYEVITSDRTVVILSLQFVCMFVLELSND